MATGMTTVAIEKDCRDAAKPPATWMVPMPGIVVPQALIAYGTNFAAKT